MPIRGANTGTSLFEQKFEARNAKFETISNDQNPKRMIQKVWVIEKLEILDLFGFRYSNSGFEAFDEVTYAEEHP